MNGFLTIITAALSSGITAAVVSSAITERKDRFLFRRERLEKIYFDLDAIYQFQIFIQRFTCLYLESQISINDLSERINSYGFKRESAVAFEMNVILYEPSLVQAVGYFQYCTMKYSDAADIMYLGRLENGLVRQEHLQKINLLYEVREQAIDSLKKEIVAKGRALAEEPPMMLGWFNKLRAWLRPPEKSTIDDAPKAPPEFAAEKPTVVSPSDAAAQL